MRLDSGAGAITRCHPISLREALRMGSPTVFEYRRTANTVCQILQHKEETEVRCKRPRRQHFIT